MLVATALYNEMSAICNSCRCPDQQFVATTRTTASRHDLLSHKCITQNDTPQREGTNWVSRCLFWKSRRRKWKKCRLGFHGAACSDRLRNIVEGENVL
jgi:hypothetical protein